MPGSEWGRFYHGLCCIRKIDPLTKRNGMSIFKTFGDAFRCRRAAVI